MQTPVGTKWCLTLLTAIFTFVGAAGFKGLREDDQTLRDANRGAANWLSNGRDYAATRFSPLKQINSSDVDQLGLAWYYDTNAAPGNLEATPLIANGTLYATTTMSVVFALDARTGKQIWRYDPMISHRNFPLGPNGIPDSSKPRIGPTFCCGPSNRGVALYEGEVYVGLLDGRLVALNARTGKVVWQVQTTPPNSDYSITGAPLIAQGKVIIGNGGAEFAVRGYVSAYDANTGQLIWRFYTVPGNTVERLENKAMEVAEKTWTGQYYKTGRTGGTVWDSISYDPNLDLLYVGTGNGAPYPQKFRSPKGGANLYLCSILALRPETGKLAWYYQTTPGDEWDYDAVQDLTLASLKINGKVRQVLMQANKNGFFYVLDRKTGKFISAMPIAHVTWATGINQKTGRPIIAPDARYNNDSAWVSPSGGGVHSWHAMSFNPDTGLVYIPGANSRMWYAAAPYFKYKLGVNNWGIIRNEPVYGTVPRGPEPGPQAPRPSTKVPAAPAFSSFLVAWDPATQEQRWRIPNMNGGGTVTTAGDLVFAATQNGHFVALDATTGKQLWETRLLPGISNPATYMVHGKQYVAVLAGRAGDGRLYTFALGAQMPMPVSQVKATETTMQEVYRSDQADRGKTDYLEQCASCHMANLSGQAEAPSLAGDSFTLSWNGHSLAELFDVIRTTMPQNKPGSLSPETYTDILAYILRFNHAPPGKSELKSDPALLQGTVVRLPRSSGGRK